MKKKVKIQRDAKRIEVVVLYSVKKAVLMKPLLLSFIDYTNRGDTALHRCVLRLFKVCCYCRIILVIAAWLIRAACCMMLALTHRTRFHCILPLFLRTKTEQECNKCYSILPLCFSHSTARWNRGATEP